MLTASGIENKSTKEIIMDYLKKNKGREIAVHEISSKFDFKLNRISNAIKELELTGEIDIDRRPLRRGKYTVVKLHGDIITEFASHEREIESYAIINKNGKINYSFDDQNINYLIDFLSSVNYVQSQLKELIDIYFDNYFSIVTECIQPILYEVGKRWQNETLSIAEEHLISARIEKFISDLIKKEAKKDSKTIILAPVDQETHTLVLLILELLLVERGLRVINLSRTLPVFSFIDFVKNMKVKPDWIFYSITLDNYIGNLKMDLKLIKHELANYDIKFAIGGQGVSKFEYNDFPTVDKLIKTSNEFRDFLEIL